MNFLDITVRKAIIDEIEGPENKARKAESLRRYEIYRERQAPYVIKKLKEEFSTQTVNEMRKITSINICPRIVNDLASIYKSEPERTYGPDLSETQQDQVKEVMKDCRLDVKLKRANQIYKLQDQCTIHVVPRSESVQVIPLHPHQYDVVPDPEDPEKALAYIISTFDKSQDTSISTGSDTTDQKIADQDDYKARLKRYVFWTPEFNFVCNKDGEFTQEPLANAIGKLPFVDVAPDDKDFEYWIRYGTNIVDFSIDFAVLLSDTANINRLQGYSQAVLVSKEIPKNFIVGPHNVLHLPQTEDGQKDPSFSFMTPQPDMQASLDLLEMYMRLFLTTRGMDPKTMSGRGDGKNFTSAIERLLSMIEKFEASKNDFDVFRRVEADVFELLKLWINIHFGTTGSPLKDVLKLSKIPEDATVDVKFAEPNFIQTQTEVEDSVIKQLDKSLMSKVEAIAKLRGVDEDKAEEILAKIDEEKKARAEMDAPPVDLNAPMGPDGKPQDPNQDPKKPFQKGEPDAAA